MEEYMSNLESKDELMLNLSGIKTSIEFQNYLQKELKFPDFYGMNWDAFWDTITGVVDLPQNLVVVGWHDLIKNIPKDASVFKDLLERYNREYPMCKCMVRYLEL